MNKRARNRMLGVTTILIASIAAIFASAGAEGGAYSRTVSEVAGNPEVIGQRIQVTGTVIPGSWDGNTSPMRFDMRNEGAETGPWVSVVYTGDVPSTFGDDVTAIVTGVMNQEGIIESKDMITKCPSRYESAAEAITVTELLEAGESMHGTSVRITGYVVDGTIQPPGGEIRFSIAAEGGAPVLDIHYPRGSFPDGMQGGSQIVLGGSLNAEGVFEAVSVAMTIQR